MSNSFRRYEAGSVANERYRRFIDKDNSDSFEHLKPVSEEIQSHGSYGSLLFDKRWRAKREEILIRDKYACVNCKRNLKLQVHHRQYHFVLNTNQFKLPWDYPNRLLISLCEKCHQKGHSKFKVPTIKI